MKILYYSNPFFLDYDLELIRELQRKTDTYYFLDISPYSMKATLLKIENNNFLDGIYPISIIEKYLPSYIKDYLDFSKCFVLIRTTNSTFSLSNIKLQTIIYNFIKSLNISILHINNYLSLKSILLLGMPGIKKVLTFHDPIPHSSERNILNTITKSLNIKASDLIILHNEYYKDSFIKRHRLKRNKVNYLPIGVYFFYAKSSLHVASEKKNQILFFGRISEYKGIEYLVQAVDRLIQDDIFCHLIIAGKGNMYFDHPLLEDFNHCTVLNRYISDDELALIIKESTVVVCPYTDATQSGVILTTFAFGKPVIATKVGGIPEMIIENETGYLVNPRDSKDLANAILKIIKNTSPIDFHSNIMNEYLTGSKSWSSISDNLVRLYKWNT